MNRPAFAVAAAVLAAGSLFATAATPRPSSFATTTGCAASWQVVAGPSVSDGWLEAVSAAASDDVWAVGGLRGRKKRGASPRQLIEHWDGGSWAVVKDAPPLGSLDDVAVVDAKSVWAVGSTNDQKPIIEHWDGAQWRSTPEPWNLIPTAITATATGEAWITGYNHFGAMILRWNGVRWLRVARRQKAGLDDITAISASDIWAVGSDSTEKLLALHWNGARWRAYRMDAGGGHDSPVGLYSVAGTSTEDVWAVGSAHPAESSGYDADPIVRHWDGRRWSVVPRPNNDGGLLAVAASSRSGPWISGLNGFSFATSGGDGSYLAVRSGSSWKSTPTPQRILNDLTADSSGALWAVGFLGSGIDEGGDGFPIHTTPTIEHYTC